MSEKRVNKLLDAETWEAMKAAGYSEEELLKDQPTGPIIYAYTRQQAIADGVLVDLTRPGFARMLALAGIKVHTAMTATAFGATVGLELSGPTPSQRELWEAVCRLGKVLSAFRSAVKGQADTDRVHFAVEGVHEPVVKLWAHIGPGDEGEPVLTLMLEGED